MPKYLLVLINESPEDNRYATIVVPDPLQRDLLIKRLNYSALYKWRPATRQENRDFDRTRSKLEARPSTWKYA